MSLGSIGQQLLPLERLFTLKPRSTPTVTDGYVLEGQGTSKTFKAILTSRPLIRLTGVIPGRDITGDASLLVRTEQNNVPAVQDEVVDENSVSWIIIEERNYETYVRMKMFILQRKV